MMEIDLDFIFFSAGIFFSLPIFWLLLAQKRQEPERSEVQIPTMVVLGSGGHTTEILRLSSSLKEEVYQPRSYVIADSDVTSEGRLRMASLGNIKSQKQ
jgi:beta-1,4-N-acetylglucosaminyltransferase